MTNYMKTNRENSLSSNGTANAFKLRSSNAPSANSEKIVHRLQDGIICDTEGCGHSQPRGMSLLELVVHASDGFIPLWAENVTLKWRFRERSMTHFEDPNATQSEIRKLLAAAILAWGSAAPVRFKEDTDVWDFEIVTRESDNCQAGGCVLASAFLPDPGRHELIIYPMLFQQTREEQVETLVHEIGHIFGLRHFFAKLETSWPSEIFGTQDKFTIMNYGSLSELTETDKSDLTNLYQLIWSGTLTKINGTKILLVKPFSSLAAVEETLPTVNLVKTRSVSRSMIAYPAQSERIV